MRSPVDMAKRQLTLTSHRIHALPVVVLMPHSRCNCRCVMCDIWKANRNKQELTVEDLTPHLETFRRLGVQWVVLSGGEALMHRNLWALCALIQALGAKISLLSTGLLLRRHAAEVVRACDDVIVSLDGSAPVHDAIRRVPDAFAKLADGVTALRQAAPGYRVTGRCVLQRRNWDDLPRIVAAAKHIGLDQISFLAADVSSEAFNRPGGWDSERTDDVALTPADADAFAQLIEETIATHVADFESGYIAESPDKLRRLGRYYLALHGHGEFPPVTCNAPWVSTVVEADGTVRPCFFHQSLGNVREASLEAILNNKEAIAFRRGLDVAQDPICQRCVCSLHLAPWDRV